MTPTHGGGTGADARTLPTGSAATIFRAILLRQTTATIHECFSQQSKHLYMRRIFNVVFRCDFFFLSLSFSLSFIYII